MFQHTARWSPALCVLALALLITDGQSAQTRQPDNRPTAAVGLKARAIPEKPASVTIDNNKPGGYVVVKFDEARRVRLQAGRLVSQTGLSIDESANIIEPYIANRLTRLFHVADEAQLDQRKTELEARSGQQLADLNSYYQIPVTSGAEAADLINRLNASSEVELAFYHPPSEPAGDIAPPTPNYKPNQDYREVAPGGVDADFLNTLAGGDGTGVKIIDIEGNWKDTHEDLDKAAGKIITPSVIIDQSWRDHGTAVLGEMIAGDNGYGVTGICPGADVGMVSIASLATSAALYTAVQNLTPGDLILIELHAPGPHYNFQSRTDQLGYVCEEYWQDNFDAIQYAWASGIIVVEAGGNGAENLDSAVYYGNMFDTTYRNSHAILVGAGYPAASASDRQKHGFSNYGERVNVQGYGSGVYTTGYGGLFNGGGDENQYYTATFSGTSSASPIITGSAACLQGYYKALYGSPLTSDQIRTAFVATGSPQLGNTALHIGPRPNLAAAIGVVPAPLSLYSTPIMIDDTVLENTSANVSLWLHNRSLSTPASFTVADPDSVNLLRVVPNWLRVTPTSGVVPANDSVELTVTLDATLLAGTLDRYIGAVDVTWGTVPNDSLLRVPVFLKVPCNDQSYTAISSNEVGGPTYTWIDARVMGTKINNATFYNTFGGDPLDDGSAGPVAIGFNFKFYGTNYAQLYVGVNGAVSFTNSEVNVNGYYSGLSLPGAPFTTFLPVFWSDLLISTSADPNAGVYVYKNAAADTIVIEWYRVANFNASGTVADFELILSKNGRIKCQYKDVESTGLNATALIGVGGSGCQGIPYYDGTIPAHKIFNLDAVQINPAGVLTMAGNVDNDPAAGIDISDLTYLIQFQFLGGDAPVVPQSADLNCDGSSDIADLTLLIQFMFLGGSDPCYFIL